LNADLSLDIIDHAMFFIRVICVWYPGPDRSAWS